MFVKEFPNNWPTFFDELIAMTALSALHKDMFLRVMDTIDEVVVSLDLARTPAEIARNTVLKDAMRVTAIPKVVATWFSILSSSGSGDAGSPNGKSSNNSVAGNANGGVDEKRLKSFTLHVVTRYVSWIDIGFFASQPFMAMMVQFLSAEMYQRKVNHCAVKGVIVDI
jgi:exportin-T